MESQILVVGHGSRSPQALRENLECIAQLRERMKRDLSVCFLELADPDLAEGLSGAADRAGKGGQVFVQPLFLGKANHQKNDLAASVQWAREQFPQVQFRQGVPLDPHAKLVQLAQVRVVEALQEGDPWSPQETGVLIVGRGSSDPDSNSEIARTARIFYEAEKYPLVEIAFQAVARPLVSEGLERCCRLGAKRIVVMPYLLFSGRVEDDIHEKCIQTAQKLGVDVKFSQHLFPDTLLLDVIEQRIKEGLEGEACMTCDVCKYRFPVAPYEWQVGSPQHTHHLHGGSETSHSHGRHQT